MDKVVASDHPDCAGGIVWSPCELRWINAKLEQQAETNFAFYGISLDIEPEAPNVGLDES